MIRKTNRAKRFWGYPLHLFGLVWLCGLSALWFWQANPLGKLSAFVDLGRDAAELFSNPDSLLFAKNTGFLFLWLGILLILGNMGHLLLERLHPPALGYQEKICLSLVLGFMLLFVLFFFLGALHLYYRHLVWGILIPALFWSLWRSWRNRLCWREVFFALSRSWRHSSIPLKVALVVAFFIQSYLLIAAFVPVWGWDMVAYNMYLPQEYIARNGLPYVEEFSFYSCFPSYVEMGHVASMLIGGEYRLAHLFCWTYSCLFAMSLVFSGRLFGLRGFLSGILYLSWFLVPVVIRMTPVGKNDIAAGLFFLWSFWWLLRWLDGGKLHYVFVAGVLGGVSLGIKYTSLYAYVALFIGLGIGVCLRESGDLFVRLRRMMAILFLFGMSSLVLMSPWLVRNLLVAGNPVFPIGSKYLGGGGSFRYTERNRACMREIMRENKTYGFMQRESFLHGFRYLVVEQSGPWPFLFLPTFFVMSILPRRGKSRGSLYQNVLLVLMFLNGVFWFSSSLGLVRYNLFFWGLVLLAGCMGLHRLLEAGRWWKPLVLLLSVLLGIYSLCYAISYHRKALSYGFSNMDRESFIREREGGFGEVILWINDNIPPDSRVYTQLAYNYYAKPQLIYHHCSSEYGAFIEMESAQSFHRRLLELDIRYVVYNMFWSSQLVDKSFAEGKGLSMRNFFRRYTEYVRQLEKSGSFEKIHTIRGAWNVYYVHDMEAPDANNSGLQNAP